MIIIKLFDAETSNPRVKFHSRVSCYIIAVLIIIAILLRLVRVTYTRFW